MDEKYDPRYMLNQIERLQWENHHLRITLIVSGADIDKINESINLESWIKEKTRRRGKNA